MKSTNKWLISGLCLIVIGLMLFIYSISTYVEVRNLYDKVDFDTLDNNTRMPTAEKYSQHLLIADFLNAKLEKNKNLPYKKVSCIYLDYARHNTVSLYKLIYNGDRNEEQRRESVAKNVQNLYDMLDNYRICRQTSEYKSELQQISEEIKKSNELYGESAMRIDSFLYGSGQIEKRDSVNEEYSALEEKSKSLDASPSQTQSQNQGGEIIYSHSYSGEDNLDNIVPEINSTNQ